MEEVGGIKKRVKGKESQYGKRYGFEFKLRCVKLRLEEGIPVSLLSKEAGCSQDVIRRWRMKNGEKQGYGVGLFRRDL
jgi:transposase-like protein